MIEGLLPCGPFAEHMTAMRELHQARVKRRDKIVMKSNRLRGLNASTPATMAKRRLSMCGTSHRLPGSPCGNPHILWLANLGSRPHTPPHGTGSSRPHHRLHGRGRTPQGDLPLGPHQRGTARERCRALVEPLPAGTSDRGRERCGFRPAAEAVHRARPR